MMSPEYLYLNSRDELLRIKTNAIVYFEADGNYTNIILSNKQKSTVCMNLSQMQSVLANSLKERAAIYARIGKRHIINLNYVLQIQVLRQRLVLSDGVSFAYQIEVSKEALKKLKELYVESVGLKVRE